MLTAIVIFLKILMPNPSGGVSALYNPESRAIEITNLSKEQAEVKVYFGDITQVDDQPEVIGKFEWKGSKLHYRAKYGFSAGNAYTIFISLEKPIRLVVNIPKEKAKPVTFVKNVFPTASTLPMNQLKFYLEFSAPMKLGQAYDHIKLYRMPDKVWEQEAFLTMPEELWGSDRKRLTIFFDPGRIKRGVQPNLQLGLPLVEGRKYKLVIDQDWLDVNGVSLATTLEKEFEVGPVDRSSPNSKNWTIQSPLSQSFESIIINFHESMDYGLLHSAIAVLDENQKRVEGTVHLEDREQRWYFTPHKPWKSTKYNLVINAWLEDLAGNNLKRKFDVDLNDPADKPKDITEIIIPLDLRVRNN